jgi:O-antigen ligase
MNRFAKASLYFLTLVFSGILIQNLALVPKLSVSLIIALCGGAILSIILAVWNPVFLLILTLSFLVSPIPRFLDLDIYKSGYLTGFLMFPILISVALTMSVQKENSRAKTSIDLPMLIFSIMILIGVIYGFIQRNNAKYLLGDIFHYSEFIIFFILTGTLIRSKKHVNTMLICIFLASMTTFLLECIRVIAGMPAETTINIGGHLFPRYGLGFFFLLEMLVLGGIYFCARSSSTNFMTGLLIALIGFRSILSFTRSFWMGILAGFCFIIFYIRSIKGMKRLASSLIVFYILFLAYNNLVSFGGKSIPELIFQRIQYTSTQLSHSEDPVMGRRLAEARSALGQIFHSPIFGKGLGGTYKEFTGSSSAELEFGERHYIHNTYLQILLRMGIIALISYLWLALTFLRSGISIFHSMEPGLYKGLVLGFLASYIGLSVVSLSADQILRHPTGAFVGTSMAMVYILQDLDRNKESI